MQALIVHCFNGHSLKERIRGANLASAVLHFAEFSQAKYDSKTLWPAGGAPQGVVLAEEDNIRQ